MQTDGPTDGLGAQKHTHILLRNFFFFDVLPAILGSLVDVTHATTEVYLFLAKMVSEWRGLSLAQNRRKSAIFFCMGVALYT